MWTQYVINCSTQGLLYFRHFQLLWEGVLVQEFPFADWNSINTHQSKEQFKTLRNKNNSKLKKLLSLLSKQTIMFLIALQENRSYRQTTLVQINYCHPVWISSFRSKLKIRLPPQTTRTIRRIFQESLALSLMLFRIH